MVAGHIYGIMLKIKNTFEIRQMLIDLPGSIHNTILPRLSVICELGANCKYCIN